MNTFYTEQRKAITEVKFAFQKAVDEVVGRMCADPEYDYKRADDVPFIRKFVVGDFKAADFEKLEPGQIKHLITTTDPDRIGDVMMPKGADLRDYKKNPIVVWGHSYYDPDNIIGKNLWIVPEENGIRALTEIDLDAQKSSRIFQLYQKGILRAWSIGFIPLKWTRVRSEAEENAESGTIVIDLRRSQPGQPKVVHEKWLLLEYSAVAVPMNPHALTDRVAKELELSDADLKEFALTVDEAAEQIGQGKVYLDISEKEEHGQEEQGGQPAAAQAPAAEGEAKGAAAAGVIDPAVKKTIDELVGMIKDLQAMVEAKEGRVLSEKNRKLIQSVVEKIDAMTSAARDAGAALKDLLNLTEPKALPEEEEDEDDAFLKVCQELESMAEEIDREKATTEGDALDAVVAEIEEGKKTTS